MTSTWIICGGRDYTDVATLCRTLDREAAERGMPTLVVTGGASGADDLGLAWAESHGIAVAKVSADWEAHGRGAGPRRNQRMLDEYKPQFVVAFPGGRGSADMIRRTMKAGITILVVDKTGAA